ncbi:hypothetical protein GCM10028818_11930 [Spirosoma horti]
MNPNKRLDQIEPVLADVALKTDRLIESNGQILEIATRADTNAKLAAKGIADLTIEMRQQFGQQQNQIDLLRVETNSRFEQVDVRFEQLSDEQAKLRQEMKEGFHDVNQKFTQVAQTQQQILTLLLDRLT